jgi:cold shock CspA family protein
MTGAPSTTFGLHDGTVTGFDDHVGAGTVEDAADGRSWWFHCTRIEDGSRSIAIGTTVRYRVVPGPTGLEAVDLAPVGAPPSL